MLSVVVIVGTTEGRWQGLIIVVGTREMGLETARGKACHWSLPLSDDRGVTARARCHRDEGDNDGEGKGKGTPWVIVIVGMREAEAETGHICSSVFPIHTLPVPNLVFGHCQRDPGLMSAIGHGRAAGFQTKATDYIDTRYVILGKGENIVAGKTVMRVD